MTGRNPPKMADVARLAGVSPMTVSRAFRGGTSVSQATRAAILTAAESLGYVLDSTASSLRSQRTDFVAVLIPSINNANFADTVDALSAALRAQGLQTLLGYTNYDSAEEEVLIEQLLRRRPQAIVVTGGSHTQRGRRLLAMAGIPVIETWDLPADPVGHVVGFSNAAVVQDLVDHFVSCGLTRIAFLGGDAMPDTRGADRRRGFIAAMQRHGLDATRLVAAGPPPISMREGAAAMGRLLQDLPDTQAVICVSDLSAFGALTECQRCGVDVPGRMRLAGFGDYEIAGICVPGLTTINPHPRDIGRRTAEVIADLLAGKSDVPRITQITPALVLRGSSQ